ncbi:MAG: general secretion pathway protein GspK [Acidobacteriota bacterium]
MRTERARRRGGALLAVLWLTAALSAIAFSVASTVRSETGRTTSSIERLKAEYLASGAVERALVYMQWGQANKNPDGTPRFEPGQTRLELEFPAGHARVDILPEFAKMNVNSSRPEDLLRLLLALGVEPGRANEIAAAIVDWRTPHPPEAATLFDQYYLSRNPSFQARHASFEEIEELLFVKGITPELFYGSYERDKEGRLTPRGGLRDCLSVYGSAGRVDANAADPAVLAAVGLTPESIAALVEMRRVRPFRNMNELAAFGHDAPGFERLSVGGTGVFTIRATAQPRLQNGSLSDARRSVAAMVKFLDPAKFQEPYHVLRWYGNVWVE